MTTRLGTLTDEGGRIRHTTTITEEKCPHCGGWSVILYASGFCPWPGCHHAFLMQHEARRGQ